MYYCSFYYSTGYIRRYFCCRGLCTSPIDADRVEEMARIADRLRSGTVLRQSSYDMTDQASKNACQKISLIPATHAASSRTSL